MFSHPDPYYQKSSTEPVQTQFVPVEVRPASSSTTAPTSKAKEAEKPAMDSFSSTDAAAGLEQILKSLFGDAVSVKAFNTNEGTKSSSSQPTCTPQAVSTSSCSLLIHFLTRFS